MQRTTLSLFSGLGGMDAGLHAAGFHNVGMVEYGEPQRESLRLNKIGHLLSEGDVNVIAQSLRPSSLGIEVGDLDLLAGGPPCQPFSTAAQWVSGGRRGMIDDRARTVFSTLKLIESFLPRFVLLENVAGFIQGPNAALSFLEAELDAISQRTGVVYTKHVRLLNAAEFGVPQNRRRAIVIFERDTKSFKWPSTLGDDEKRSTWDALYDLHVEDPPAPKGKWAPLLASIPAGENYQWLTARGGGPELFGYRTKFWNFLLKLHPEFPAWTLSASPGPSTGPFHWENRPLAIQEQLRLQSFPDGWRVSGDLRQQTLQVGNATPSLLAEALGRQILLALNHPVRANLQLLRPKAFAAPPQMTHLSEVPRAFEHQIARHAPHGGTGQGPAPRVAEPTLNSDLEVQHA